MRTIRLSIKPQKNIDFNFLIEKYKNKIDINNYNFDTNILDLKDVDKAAELLIWHMNNNSHIALVTDFDSDGVNSAIVLTKGLRKLLGYKNTSTIVNKRIHNNGFNPILIDRIVSLHKTKKIDLIITADHGSNDNDAFLKLKELCDNVAILLTDHHTIKKYPTCVEVFVNPQREDSTYAKSISGCCTAFLLLVQTFKIKNIDFKKLYELVPYVAISTITDCMDMKVPYNRFIVEMGLRIMNSERFIIWHIFKLILKLGIKYSVFDLGFKIGPLINCGNTVNQEETIYNMLMEKDIDKLEELINKVIGLNTSRKELTKKYSDILEENLKDDNTICEIVHVKERAILNGKIASMIGGKYNKPTIIFSKNKDNLYSGSGRGIINNFNILEIVDKIKNNHNDIIHTHGGHYGALGCTIYPDKFERFRELLNSYTNDILKDREDIIEADTFVHPKDINNYLFAQQEVYGPYGQDYKEPIYVTVVNIDRIFDYGPIAKFMVSLGDYKLNGVYFFNDTSITKNNVLSFRGKQAYIAFTINLSTFRGSYELNLNIVRIEEIKK